jgi:hypothetical protein
MFVSVGSLSLDCWIACGALVSALADPASAAAVSAVPAMNANAAAAVRSFISGHFREGDGKIPPSCSEALKRF